MAKSSYFFTYFHKIIYFDKNVVLKESFECFPLKFSGTFTVKLRKILSENLNENIQKFTRKSAFYQKQFGNALRFIRHFSLVRHNTISSRGGGSEMKRKLSFAREISS